MKKFIFHKKSLSFSVIFKKKTSTGTMSKYLFSLFHYGRPIGKLFNVQYDAEVWNKLLFQKEITFEKQSRTCQF